MQLYDCRQKAVRDDGEEKEQYGQLTLDFMSEESSCDETVITIHCPEWRSDSKLVFVKMATMRLCRDLGPLPPFIFPHRADAFSS